MPLNEAGASVPVLIEVCLHEPGCLLDPNWFASLGRLAKSIVMLLDLLLVCLGPLVANGPLARLIRVDESGQLVLPPSGERVVGWSGFCLPAGLCCCCIWLLASSSGSQHSSCQSCQLCSTWAGGGPVGCLGGGTAGCLGGGPAGCLGLGCGGCLWPCFGPPLCLLRSCSFLAPAGLAWVYLGGAGGPWTVAAAPAVAVAAGLAVGGGGGGVAAGVAAGLAAVVFAAAGVGGAAAGAAVVFAAGGVGGVAAGASGVAGAVAPDACAAGAAGESVVATAGVAGVVGCGAVVAAGAAGSGSALGAVDLGAVGGTASGTWRCASNTLLASNTRSAAIGSCGCGGTGKLKPWTTGMGTCMRGSGSGGGYPKLPAIHGIVAGWGGAV